jgi:hypothetical protein
MQDYILKPGLYNYTIVVIMMVMMPMVAVMPMMMVINLRDIRLRE